MLELSHHVRQFVPADDAFGFIMGLRGPVFRQHKNRITMRVEIGGKRYFLKIHRPTSWKEIAKNVLRLRWPVLNARPEWIAIARLQALGVATTPAAGIGVRGRRPDSQESFLLTDALEDMIHLDELTTRLQALSPVQQTRIIRIAIAEMAQIARTLHANGLNHRDFYLCHFMLPDRDWTRIARDDSLLLHVIDLHRMQSRPHTPVRWVIKDLSGLLFSALDVEITSRDLIRFLKVYWNEHWRERCRASRSWRRQIVRRAVSLYRSEHGRSPRLPAGLASSA